MSLLAAVHIRNQMLSRLHPLRRRRSKSSLRSRRRPRRRWLPERQCPPRVGRSSSCKHLPRHSKKWSSRNLRPITCGCRATGRGAMIVMNGGLGAGKFRRAQVPSGLHPVGNAWPMAVIALPRAIGGKRGWAHDFQTPLGSRGSDRYGRCLFCVFGLCGRRRVVRAGGIEPPT